MTRATGEEAALVAALKDGDEAAFAQLVDRHTPSMLRVARGYVRSHETAEEVVQEAWIALLKGIGKFEGRSSLRTWLFTVLINIAKTAGRATAAIRTSKFWRSPAAPSTRPFSARERSIPGALATGRGPHPVSRYARGFGTRR
jgi:RNA polymerase sigma-70 factor (ECF subfamily)